MCVDQTEVRKFVKEWANNESKPHFAVLIEGPWGCGKTHFVTELLEDVAFADRKPIYLSVFGISDIQSLETSLFLASASTATKTLHKGIGLAGSIFSGAITLGSGISANLNKLVNESNFLLEKFVKNMNRGLLVIDDLERCKIPMSELLGVVNRFVEHGDTRVILCANTQEFEDDHFTVFKEKVVGHSFFLESDPDSALNSFLGEIRQSKAHQPLENHKNDIRELYNKSGYHNLRALRQFVWHLASILELMKKDYRQNDGLVRNLIDQFFIFFIEFKLGLADESASLSPQNLVGEHDVDKVWSVYEFSVDENNGPSLKKRILDKYGHPNGIRTVITVQQWISILTSGVVDADRLNDELAHSSEVAGVESWPSWKRLWYLHDLDFSDDDTEAKFWSDIEDMKSKLKNGSYVEVKEFLHVVGISLMLANYKLIKQSVPDTVSQMKKYIDDHFVTKLTAERYRRFSEISGRELKGYDGLGFMRRKDAEFGEVSEYLVQKMDAWYKTWLNRNAGEQLLGYLSEDHDPIRFIENLTFIKHAPEQHYLNVPILHNIEEAAFVDALFRLSPRDEIFVVDRMKELYESYPKLLDDEGPWWRKVQDELSHRIASSESKPRNIQIENLIGLINSSIIERWKQRQPKESSRDNASDPELNVPNAAS